MREVVEKGTTPEALWSQMLELGWPALTVPENAGGLGMGAVELAVVVEELGRVLAPGPYLPTVTQFAPVVAEAGSPEQQERFLGGVAAGELTGTLALVEESGSVDVGRLAATATPDGAGFVLHGTKETVVDASVADEVAVIARTPDTNADEGVGAFVVSRADLRVEPIEALDASRPLARVGVGRGPVAAAHPPQRRGQPAPARHRLHRPLPGARPRPRHPAPRARATARARSEP